MNDWYVSNNLRSSGRNSFFRAINVSLFSIFQTTADANELKI